MYRVQKSLSITIYHDGVKNIYWDVGLQKHMTLKRTKLLKQPNNKGIKNVLNSDVFIFCPARYKRKRSAFSGDAIF